MEPRRRIMISHDGAVDDPPEHLPDRDDALLRCGSGSRCTTNRTIVLLTVFRKTRQHDQRQIDRAVRAQKICERDHWGPVTKTFERQV